MVCGPLPETLNTSGLLLSNKIFCLYFIRTIVATSMQQVFTLTDKKTTLLQVLEIGSQFDCKSQKTLNNVGRPRALSCKLP